MRRSPTKTRRCSTESCTRLGWIFRHLPGTPTGPEGVKPLLAGLTTTFPDLKLTIEDIRQEGDKVVVRARMTGTQKEAFMGFPSKNRKMDIQIVDIHELKTGGLFEPGTRRIG
jgi:predicted ester cyclase